MRTLKKQRNESVKNYEVLQNRCGCGTCGCGCSSDCGGNQANATMSNLNTGSAEGGYRVNLGIHS